MILQVDVLWEDVIVNQKQIKNMVIIALILNIILGIGNGFVYYKNKKYIGNLLICLLNTIAVLLLIIKILK